MPKHERPKVLTTIALPQEVEQRLSSGYNWVNGGNNWRDRIRDFAPRALIVTPVDQVTAHDIDGFPPSLKFIGCFSVGYGHIDLSAAQRNGIKVSNTPGVLTDATADLTFALILGATRRLRPATTQLLSKQWTGWEPTQFLGTGLQGKSLGIVGFGRIGQAVARRALPFGLKIIVYSRTPPSSMIDIPFELCGDFQTFLGLSDIVSLHCPLNDQTRHLINAETLAQMKPGAILINSARGGVIDDVAVLKALETGQLSAVGLDVFANEPHLHPGYLQEERAYILPHLGSATIETRNAMGRRVLDNLDAFFGGRPLPDEVL